MVISLYGSLHYQWGGVYCIVGGLADPLVNLQALAASGGTAAPSAPGAPKALYIGRHYHHLSPATATVDQNKKTARQKEHSEPESHKAHIHS